jgi:hypothetical protein
MRFIAALCLTLVISGCSKSWFAAPMTMKSAVPVSVSPSSGRGSTQTFTAVYRDPKGGTHIATATLAIMNMDVRPGSKAGWSTNGCLLRFDLQKRLISLAPNVGGTWGYHPIVAGSSSTLSNSQCTAMGVGSSSKVAGDTIIANFDVAFAPEFAGEKQLFLQSADMEGRWSANYQQSFGSFTVTTAAPVDSSDSAAPH